MEAVLSARDDSTPSQAGPNRAAISADGTALEVTLENNTPFTLSAGRLRIACRCAHCRRAQIDGVFAPAVDAIAITAIAPIGLYAVNLGFSDGHARGIFPWDYLKELAAAEPQGNH
jgi:DUF971 family protein